ncbi:MAG: RDD family protein, partial [Acidimicrobiia bacterium]
MSSDGIVTPEAVVLEFETAGLGSRMVAYTIDALIQGALLVAFFVAAALVSDMLGSMGWLGAALIYITLFLLLFAYAPVFETFWRG